MIAALLLSLALSAPTEVEIHFMPLGTALTLPSGEQVRYFNFEEYKLLLQIDNDLWLQQEQTANCMKVVKLHGDLLTEKDTIIRTIEEDKRVLWDQLKRAEERWHDAERRYVEASGGPVWPYALAAGGVIVGVVGATLYASELLRH